MHDTLETKQTAISIDQSKQSRILSFPDNARVRPAHSLPKRGALETLLKSVNPAVKMSAVLDQLHENIWGKGMDTAMLRRIYGVSKDESLRRVLSEQSPLMYGALKNAENRLMIFIQGKEAAGQRLLLRDIYFAVGNIANMCREEMYNFVTKMQDQIPDLHYDVMANEFSAPEDEETDEDVPF